MKNVLKNTSLLKNSFSPNAILQAIEDDKGVIEVTNEKVTGLLNWSVKEQWGC